jgi:plasmid maintenance system antidote protein VapI
MPTKSPMTDALRKAINDSGITSKALERETGVKRASIVRFRRGDQSLRLDLADKLAVYFGLDMVPNKRKGKGAGND